MEVIPLLHNVSSVQRLVDTAKISYSLGANTFVATKVYGGAAQSGVAEAMRIALRLNKSFIVLPDLQDAIELLSPKKTVLVTQAYAKKLLNPCSLPSDFLENNGKLLLIVSGSEPEFSPSELKLGEPIYLEGTSRRIGPIGELSLLLYALLGPRRRG